MKGWLIYEFGQSRNHEVKIYPWEHDESINLDLFEVTRGKNIQMSHEAERIILRREDGLRVELKSRYGPRRVLPPCCSDKCIYHP